MTELSDLLKELRNIRVTLKELSDKTIPITNASMTKEYDTSVTSEKKFDAHELLGVPRTVKILSITVLDIGGGLTIRVNGDDRPTTTVKGSMWTNELIESVGLVGGGAGTAYIRFGFYIPQGE